MTDAAAPLALLAGASRGLGLALAHELGSRGYRLAICARDERELDLAADDLRRRGHQVHTEVVDVADRDGVTRWVSDVEEEVGAIEVMICVAGIIQVGPLDDLDRSLFGEAIDVMLWGPVNIALAVLPAMRRRGRGRIGIITSVGGLLAAPHLLPYSTAKFGAVGFSRGLRSELVGTGVSVTTVAPGLMRTGSHQRASFVGDHGREYAWFAAAASLPLLSMDADRAARRIVEAVLRGRADLLLTPLAQIASRFAVLAPNLTAALLALTVRLLPRSVGAIEGARPVEGRAARERLSPRSRTVLDKITTLGDRAARRFLQ